MPPTKRGAKRQAGTTSRATRANPSSTVSTVDEADTLGTEGVTWGLVNAYSVNDERLMIKLDAGAINHRLVWVSADSPMFRSAVSMAMMAHHTPDTRLTVRYFKPDFLPGLGDRDILYAREVGIGDDPEKALSFDDWKIELP